MKMRQIMSQDNQEYKEEEDNYDEYVNIEVKQIKEEGGE